MKKLVLIDSNALVHRAFHALPPTLNSATGVPTNAIFGFMAVMIRMIKDLKPDYIAATFDLPGATFRHEEFAEYKSHRVKAPDELYLQIPYIKEILTKFGIPIFEKSGFEADDLIGALAEQAKTEKDLQVVIMTGDLDTLQLVEGDKVVVFTLRKGMTDTMIYNEKEVVARYGLNPNQVIDYKGLKGDPSDNIPGVPGIGDKTASALIQTFGNLESLYKAISNFQFPISKKDKEKIKPPLSEKLIQKLLDNKDQAVFSKYLSTIIRNVDIDFDLKKTEWREHLDKSALEKLLKDLALYSIVKRLGEIDPAKLAGAGGSTPEPASLFDVPKEPKVSTDGIKTTLAGSVAEVEKTLNKIESVGSVALDIQNGVVMLGLSAKGGPASGGDIPIVLGFPETILKDENLLAHFGKIISNPDIVKVAHDAKMISRWALEQGIESADFAFDTKLAAYLLNSEVKDFLLERLFFAEFGRDMDSEPLKRPAYILMLKERYEAKLKEFELTKVLNDIELPLSPILARMERVGIKVDAKMLEKLSILISKEIESLEKKISEMAGGEFNINSPKQLSVVLFEKLDLKSKVRKTGKGALSTAHSELEKLAHEHPIIEFILKYRELQKLKTTYIEPFPALLDSAGRVHTTYNQTGTITGRLSSQDPNLQNIPIRTELGQEFRKAFIAEKDFVLLSCDYSQIDLRVAAHLSGDSAMSEAFKKGEDIHTRTAAGVFHVSADKVTPNMRRQAKTLNFGVLYGMGLLGFQRASGVSRAEAKEFIDNYMQEFSGLAEYLEKVKQQARKNGYVETLFGRRRQIPEILSTMPMLRAGAERMAINMPIQGCLPYATKVLTSGGYMSIGELYYAQERPRLVWTGTKWATYSVLDRGIARLAEIVFSNGQVFKCDDRHEVLVITEKGYEWRKFKELKKDEEVCFSFPSTFQFESQSDFNFAFSPNTNNSKPLTVNKLSDRLFYWLGYYYGDGHFTEKLRPGGPSRRAKLYMRSSMDYVFGFTEQSKSEECVGFYQSMGLNPLSRVTMSTSNNPKYLVNISSKGLGELLKAINVTPNENAKTKRLLPRIFKESFENRVAFIKGIMDSDGNYGKDEDRIVPNIHLAQRELLEDIQLLLRTLGVTSKIRGPYIYRGFTSYRLDIPRRTLFKILNLKHSEFSRTSDKATPRFILKSFCDKYPALPKKLFGKYSDYILYRRWLGGGSSSIYQLVEFLQRNKLEIDIPLYDWNYIVSTKEHDTFDTTYTLAVNDPGHRFDSEGVISKNTAADLIKIAMIDVQKLINDKYPDNVRMLLQVHDELLFEVKKDVVEKVAKEIKEIMESAHHFDVPIVADAKAGDNWAEMKEI